jgi:hypothetical protein
MMSSIFYLNSAVIIFPIYNNSQMLVDGHIVAIIVHQLDRKQMLVLDTSVDRNCFAQIEG